MDGEEKGKEGRRRSPEVVQDGWLVDPNECMSSPHPPPTSFIGCS